ncbi:hypothetical protein ACFW1M_35325 [Streptomyces inhibens]|uniref:hypothetical protein n=1 Tax=Streptomyces inhibens TaxID=2293571 RepID=UPI0036CE8BFF
MTQALTSSSDAAGSPAPARSWDHPRTKEGPKPRGSATAWFAQDNRAILRINPSGTPWFQDDLAAAARHGCCPVMVPKSEDPTLRADITARTVLDH